MRFPRVTVLLAAFLVSTVCAEEPKPLQPLPLPKPPLEIDIPRLLQPDFHFEIPDGRRQRERATGEGPTGCPSELLPVAQGTLALADLPDATPETLEAADKAYKRDPSARNATIRNRTMLHARWYMLSREIAQRLNLDSEPGADADLQAALQSAKQDRQVRPEDLVIAESKIRRLEELRKAVKKFDAMIASGKLTSYAYPNISALLASLESHPLHESARDALIRTLLVTERHSKLGPRFLLREDLEKRADELLAEEEKEKRANQGFFGAMADLGHKILHIADPKTVELSVAILEISQAYAKGTNPPSEKLFSVLRALNDGQTRARVALLAAGQLNLSVEQKKALGKFAPPGCEGAEINRGIRFLRAQGISAEWEKAIAQYPEALEEEPRPREFTARMQKLIDEAGSANQKSGGTDEVRFARQGNRPLCVGCAVANQVSKQYWLGDEEADVDVEKTFARLGGDKKVGAPALVESLPALKAAGGVVDDRGRTYKVDQHVLPMKKDAVAKEELLPAFKRIRQNGGTLIVTIDTDGFEETEDGRYYVKQLAQMGHALHLVDYRREMDPETSRMVDFFIVEDSHQDPKKQAVRHKIPAPILASRVEEAAVVKLVKPKAK